MLCSGRIITCSFAPQKQSTIPRIWRDKQPPLIRWRSAATDGGASDGESSAAATISDVPGADPNTAGFCIIEGPETVQDFAKMELMEIQDNIRSRRNKIFLHMEEVRRLRIQQRIKNAELGIAEETRENETPDFPSFIPFLPPLTSANLKVYYATCFSLISAIILFGGLLAPTLELKLGLGGTSYVDFIRSVHLPMQLSEVDPIVASFSGGAVGVISALMVVEINNVKQQEHKRCKYCLGTGYLACARCSSTGSAVIPEPISSVSGFSLPVSTARTERCSNCSGSGKVSDYDRFYRQYTPNLKTLIETLKGELVGIECLKEVYHLQFRELQRERERDDRLLRERGEVMCPTCLCTGMAMASEHDPRIDPFD